MLVNELVLLEPLLKKGTDKEIITQLVSNVSHKAQGLVKDYNWKMLDLTILASQFFGDNEE